MNILTFCQFYYPENFTITPLMRQLVAQGHQVTVVTGRPNAGFGRILPEYKNCSFEILDGVKVHRLPIVARRPGRLGLIINYFSYYFRGRQFARKHQGNYDIVFGMSLSPVISLVPAIDFARKHKLPLMLYCVDIWPESAVFTNYIQRDTLAYQILKSWSQRIYRAADRLLVGSPSYQEYMIKEHHLDANKLNVLVQPALTSELKLAPITYEAPYNLVYIGNIGQVQLLDELVSAMERLSDNVHLHLIGYGTAWPRIQEFIKTHQLSARIHYYGTLKSAEAVAYIPKATAVVVALKDGGYVGQTIPNKLIMYLGFGRPIIGAIAGDGANVLREAGGGIIVAPTVDGFIEGVQTLISLTDAEKNALGARNQSYFNQHFTLEKIGRKLEDYLRELIN